VTLDSVPAALHSACVDRLAVRVYSDRRQMGAAAGMEAACLLRRVLRQQARATVVFAAAPSQNEFLATLTSAPAIDWQRVVALHMDEYVGLPAGAPQTFAAYLRRHLFDRVQIGEVHYLDGAAADLEAEIGRYSRLIVANPIDLVCAGIGENGHLAFNDPNVADFVDTALVKPVELDLQCRQQQVNDGCFEALPAVPSHALTLTIPALLSARWIVCTVPGSAKAGAVQRTLSGPITPDVPATVLRSHPRAQLFLDLDAAASAWPSPRGKGQQFSLRRECLAQRSRRLSLGQIRRKRPGSGDPSRASEERVSGTHSYSELLGQRVDYSDL